jgi:hypothetical protein
MVAHAGHCGASPRRPLAYLARAAPWPEQRWPVAAARWLPDATKGPIHVKITAVVESNNGASFQWYFSNAQCFSGIFLKMESFNGMDPILPSFKAYVAITSLAPTP